MLSVESGKKKRSRFITVIAEEFLGRFGKILENTDMLCHQNIHKQTNHNKLSNIIIYYNR